MDEYRLLTINFLEIPSLVIIEKSRHDFEIFDHKIGLNMREKWDAVCAQVWVYIHPCAHVETKAGSWES